ncbi:MAG: transposase [Planctomycetota bacterium]|jgi:hypothetical protein
MTQPRRNLIDLSVSKIYHCISRCVRQLSLLDGSGEHPGTSANRKAWIEQRLKVLTESFAISVAEYAVMGNHLHILVRINPEISSDWTEEEVFSRWLLANPQKNLDPCDRAKFEAWISKEKKKPDRARVLRGRLTDLGWFMKCLKEPIAKLANAEDNCKGPFWDGRYKSIAVVDEEALLTTAVYIALNPFAANLCDAPEKSNFTGLVQRLAHAIEKRPSQKPGSEGIEPLRQSPVANRRTLGLVERENWLCPLNDLSVESEGRPGLLKGFSLMGYLELIDYTSRLRRPEKRFLDAHVPKIFERLRLCPERWAGRMSLLVKSGQFRGNYFASSRQQLHRVAKTKGRMRLNNIVPLSGKN